MDVTMKVSEHLRRLGINLSELSRKTGIAYSALYRSLGYETPKRHLRAGEFLDICALLELYPLDFR